MEVLGGNEYMCDAGEVITFSFSTPNRDNLRIRKSLNGGPLNIVTGDSTSLTIGNTEQTLTLTFKFVTGKNATCDITIDGSNGGQDTDVAQDIGIPDRKDYLFKPRSEDE